MNTAEDPYASMEKDQLISMKHFLVKRENELIKRGQSELVHLTEREQVRITFKAIMQGRTDYENMLPMTIKLS